MRLKFTVTLLLIATLLLAACGGSSSVEEPTAVSVESAAETEETDPVEEEVDEPVEEETAEEVMEEETAEEAEETMEEETAEETMEEETAEEAEEVMEEAPSGFGDLALTGTDEATGLEINPTTYGPGDTFIIRGTVISMNLTPVTSPEFLVESPDGTRYRFRSQSLDDTFFTDGTQWKPFEYRQGVGAMATLAFEASASQSDIPVAEDLTLVMQE